MVSGERIYRVALLPEILLADARRQNVVPPDDHQELREEWIAKIHAFFPTVSFRNKAQTILLEVLAGGDYHVFRGKRLLFDRHIISIPVGRNYRFIFEQTPQGIFPKELLTHERYSSSKKPGIR